MFEDELHHIRFSIVSLVKALIKKGLITPEDLKEASAEIDADFAEHSRKLEASEGETAQ